MVGVSIERHGDDHQAEGKSRGWFDILGFRRIHGYVRRCSFVDTYLFNFNKQPQSENCQQLIHREEFHC
jgi:hypothetical protein